MITSYHTHTLWSDGQTDIDGLLAGTRAARISELGISDHLAIPPWDEAVSWSMALDRVKDYVASVQMVAAGVRDPVVRVGIEVDFFPETINAVSERLLHLPFDYLIGSVHFVDRFPVDEDAERWEALSAGARDVIWREYWRRIRQMAESGLFDIAGHLDLPKKYGFRPTLDMTADILSALDAIARNEMAIELNTAGWDKPVAEAYPSSDILFEANQRGIPLIITADAHCPADLTRHYARARDVARDAGYREVVRYERRRRITVPL